MRTLIVDDEPLGLNELRYLLSHHNDIEVVAESGSMQQALKLLQQTKLDLALLDIQMSDKQAGLKIAHAISKHTKPPMIIFVTAHAEHALKAYDYQPLHFLLKPISEQKLDQALQRARAVFNQATTISSTDSVTPLIFKYKSQNKHDETIRPTAYLATHEVLYIHKGKLTNTTRVHGVDGIVYEGVRRTLQQFESELLDKHFFRIHTSFLVNLLHVRGLTPRSAGDDNTSLLLKYTTTELPVSKQRISGLKAALKLV